MSRSEKQNSTMYPFGLGQQTKCPTLVATCACNIRTYQREYIVMGFLAKIFSQFTRGEAS